MANGQQLSLLTANRPNRSAWEEFCKAKKQMQSTLLDNGRTCAFFPMRQFESEMENRSETIVFIERKMLCKYFFALIVRAIKLNSTKSIRSIVTRFLCFSSNRSHRTSSHQC
ncbi:hypothetical protein T4E_836 [Trichinella pseudospiralis]|uniref:Uncharacterized protein n=1 Tax=Trichinella pseudospiralis TaxID=6337 RepID=A0A0V0YDJ8_TRIPS|nr:hypothetical protein T4E_836 [Trichinella pseudospiralis]